ncbi:hypothetical protein [Maridesulfovibrio hydrothermalis]|uniref:Uncharacterized protein n=1 Tax=Maridesulfovibrio hydrothermalis AM13 = DSM 14728 TaxID=1121451 RepID=L0RBW6_9BACT|nr:hypothetical protein [Maridesulfovibrio hydrothermalis]CCO23717.1 protein of unknown function [Maridesulfovibrio hydrothermalis AM13 = DSM 14728]
MALSPLEMANQLVEIYGDQKRRYSLDVDDFKRLAGKNRLKGSYVSYVQEELAEKGYQLINMREQEDSFGVVKSDLVNNWPKVKADNYAGDVEDDSEQE